VFKNNKKIIIAIIILLLFLQLGLFLIFNKNNQIKKTLHNFRYLKQDTFFLDDKKDDVSVNKPNHSAYFMSKDFYDDAYKQNNNITKYSEQVYGGIVPHHLLVKEKIADYFKSLENQNYERVVLIGPNHFDSGDSNIIISEANWETPYGALEADIKLTQALTKIDGVEIDEYPFVREHSISSLVSFVKKSLGNVKFTPIILKTPVSEDEILNLAKEIFNNIDAEKTLVLSSVDFSHYQPVGVAEFHDRRSNAIIQNFDFDRMMSIEVDSPASIYVLEKYLFLNKINKAELIYHTNSGIIMGEEDEPTTTHNFFIFKKNSIVEKDNVINTLFFGDLMLDRYVKTQIEKKDLTYLLENLAGGEKRFFQGVDIISANLEGVVTAGGKHYSPQKTHDFAFDFEYIKELKEYNFNFFNLANNHFYDQGVRGLEETRINLQDLNIAYSGNHLRSVDKNTVKILDVANLKIAMLGLNITAGMFDEKEVNNLIQGLRNEVDKIIVNIHWGVEYSHNQNKTQIKVAHELIDNGVDLIIGHHSHVVQGAELYKNKMIFYSLGNFIFDQYFSSDTQEGLVVGVNFSNTESEYYLFPIHSAMSRVSLLKEGEKKRFLKEFVSFSKLNENIKKSITEQGGFIIE